MAFATPSVCPLLLVEGGSSTDLIPKSNFVATVSLSGNTEAELATLSCALYSL